MDRRTFLKRLGIGLALAACPLPLLANTRASVTERSSDIQPLTTPEPLTKDNVLDFIEECGKFLDEQDIPHSDRWVLVPEFYAERLGFVSTAKETEQVIIWSTPQNPNKQYDFIEFNDDHIYLGEGEPWTFQEDHS